MEELKTKWISNLKIQRHEPSRDKIYVTYAEIPNRWRRVTVSYDYDQAPADSLEFDLRHPHHLKDKSARIYESIRMSLPGIQFYDTVTNLKLETEGGRLHIHVTEDVNDIIPYPPVYRIPDRDSVDEFLYEVNALSELKGSKNVIQLEGLVIDDDKKLIKGLLLAYAEQGALSDILYDSKEGHTRLPWVRRERWAKQIIQGLSDLHEAGFVHGDFTISNIVIDANDEAQIIDINRRGCPKRWEPPEMAPLLESGQRLTMYIGVKSDLYQLGMFLWALAMEQDEPERAPRPLLLDNAGDEVPQYYRYSTRTCLREKPKLRVAAKDLLPMFSALAFSDLCRRDPNSEHASRKEGRHSFEGFDSGLLDMDPDCAMSEHSLELAGIGGHKILTFSISHE